ncbi:MAG: HU family DNA-binding protein [candidate division Zixibacteria bacterium]|nr:HU family DNA-binding protein [candidate division Zixibacteria bacterium]
MAKDAKINKAQAKRAMSALLDGITTNLKKGKRVTFVGFGTFNVTKRKARTGRNPQTGASIKIPAAKVPKFKPGKGLKDALN